MSGIASVLPCKPMNASMHEHTMQDTGIQDKSFSESYLNSVGWRQSACHTRGLGESAPLSRSYAAQKQNPPSLYTSIHRSAVTPSTFHSLSPPIARFCPNRAFCVAGAPDFKPTSSMERGDADVGAESERAGWEGWDEWVSALLTLIWNV